MTASGGHCSTLERSKKYSGVVALEFVLILPLVIGLLYGGMVYGFLFFFKVEMQRAVDSAVASVYQLDRRNYDSFDEALVAGHACDTLDSLMSGMSAPVDGTNCETAQSSGMSDDEWEEGRANWCAANGSMVACGLKMASPVFPVLSFGGLAEFPPQPDGAITVRAAISF